MATVRIYGGSGKSGSAPKHGSPLLTGVIVGIAVIVAWILFARVVNKDVGVTAWGVGGLIGLVVAKSARPPTKATGWLAVILTVVTVLVAKVAVVVFALQPALREALIHEGLDEKVGFWVLMVLSFTPLDLLWMGLGIGSAWTLGQGRI